MGYLQALCELTSYSGVVIAVKSTDESSKNLRMEVMSRGCDHIEVYGIHYTLYDLLSATDDIQVM